MTSSPTTSIEVSALGEYLDRALRRVEEALRDYLPAVDTAPGAACPARLALAMRYSALGGGKRLRPVLCLMAAEACGGNGEAALPAACALEMVHTYSLIHDDLPAMDDDDLRRGRSTCHRAFDEATAILAGDGLLTLAFEVVAREVRPGAVALRCVAILAEAAGPSGMVAGQMADLQAEGRTELQIHGRHGAPAVETTGTLAALEAIHRRKTGALLRAPLRMGAVIAGAPESCIDALDRYGKAVGLAFQIVDDLLDVQGDEGKLGKRVGKDSELGKWTYPRFLGVDGSRRRARQLADEAVAELEPLGPRGQRLRDLALALLERDR
ncbi:MAG: polyprenyl synthetase family protein [Isosphaerales bacterium]